MYASGIHFVFPVVAAFTAQRYILAMRIEGYQDYRKFLRDELEARMGLNPLYSLRAFARDLTISPQMLSLVMNGKKGLSNQSALRMADRLSLDPTATEHFADLVLLARPASPEVKSMVERRISKRAKKTSPKSFASIDLNAFRTISDWHHYAILELLETEDFRADITWISQRLGIKPFEARQAVDRLEALKLIAKDKSGSWVRTNVNLTATYHAPNSALRKLAKQYLEKSIAALDSQSLEERDVTNITMAIDPALLPEAKEMITQFRRQLCAFLESGQRTEVYVFAPSLFKLTKDTNRGES